MAREKRLENNQQNVLYVAAYLKYWQDTWKDVYPEIDGRSAVLGTLYNLGKNANPPNPSPIPNDFGNYVKENYYYMGKLLEMDKILFWCFLKVFLIFEEPQNTWEVSMKRPLIIILLIPVLIWIVSLVKCEVLLRLVMKKPTCWVNKNTLKY